MRYREQKVGTRTFALIINSINELRQSVGIRAITLFSVPKAVKFYSESNFTALSEGMDMYLHPSCEGCIPMYLVLPEIEFDVV